MVAMVTTFLRLSSRDSQDNNRFPIYGYHHPPGACVDDTHGVSRLNAVPHGRCPTRVALFEAEDGG